MGCNAWNHPPECQCGWGGDGHKGKSPGGWRLDRCSNDDMKPELTARSSAEIGSQTTKCPKCGSDVFFIRHNGGAVWLDPPLSPPWYKHPCFDYEVRGTKRRKLLDEKGVRRKVQSISTKIFVVESCVFSPRFSTTKLKGWYEDGGLYTVSVRGDARRFAGGLCFINNSTKEFWLYNKPELKLAFQGSVSKIADTNLLNGGKANLFDRLDDARGRSSLKSSTSSLQRSYPCKLCKARCSSQKNYRKHLNKVHGAVEISSAENLGGFFVVDEDKFYVANESVFDYEAVEINVESLKEKNLEADLKSQNYLFSIVTEAIVNSSDSSGWANLAKVGNWIYKHHPEFRTKDYGFNKLYSLVKSLDYVEVDQALIKKRLGTAVVHVRVV